jgi:inner membrane protein involved in colicin E2 resistance
LARISWRGTSVTCPRSGSSPYNTHRFAAGKSQSSVWGDSQLLIGHVLFVPYSITRITTVGDRRVEEIQGRYAVFLPEVLTIKGDSKTTTLHRSIFEFPVFTSELDFEGRFASPRIADVAAQVHEVRWRDAVLAMAINDVSGLKSTVNAIINETGTASFDPFLATAYMAVFLLEFRSAHQIHPVQYFFVGFAMLFFYVLLLSIAEHIGFVRAYLVAAGATGLLLGFYVGRAQSRASPPWRCFSCFTGCSS